MTDPISQLLGEWAGRLNVYSLALRLVLSMVLAAILGCDRAKKRHSAGLRTFVLVSLSGTVAVIMDLYLNETIGKTLPIITGATVLAATLISGNSVLFSSRNRIKGLTTSAGLWLCCLLGVCAGAGCYTMTFIVFAAVLACLSLLPGIEVLLQDHSNHFEIHLELKDRKDLPDFLATVRKLGIRVDDIEANPAYVTSGLSVYSISFTVVNAQLPSCRKHRDLIEALRVLDCVSYIEELR